MVDGRRWARKEANAGEILALTGEGLLVKTGQGVLLLTDADLEGASEPGLASLLHVGRMGLPTILG